MKCQCNTFRRDDSSLSPALLYRRAVLSPFHISNKSAFYAAIIIFYFDGRGSGDAFSLFTVDKISAAVSPRHADWHCHLIILRGIIIDKALAGRALAHQCHQNSLRK